MEGTSEKPVFKEENEDESNVITLDEFIEEETRLETDANALLGPSDDKNCTYNQGYMVRQALYACKTCRSEDGALVAGVCLACTYHCHEGHDLVELYTKRNFRCDCGNSRFKGKKCNLEPKKDVENTNNKYNHNFDGSYCTCKRPYPDPEDSLPDEMIQCIVCEDWYHTRHLHTEMPPEDNYAEMICPACMDSLPFLNKYLGYAITKITKDGNSSIDVIKNGDNSVCNLKESVSKMISNGHLLESREGAKGSATDSFESKASTASSEIIQNSDSKVPNDNKTVETCINGDEETIRKTPFESKEEFCSQQNPKTCLLDNLVEVAREKKGATFWPHGFRSILCTCDTCKEMYCKLGVSYLLEPNDTVQSYEEKGHTIATGSDSSKHSLDGVLGMLSNIGMDRYSQAEAILNYNDLKSNLRDYLSKFVENKKVVREEDIHEFFTQMKARKRQKMDVPFTCR